VMDERDIELELLKMKRLAELSRRLKKSNKEISEDPLKLLNSLLSEKAKEVLKVAEQQFPRETKRIVDVLARLVKEGKIKSIITGYSLYQLFLDLGLKIRMPTKIYYEEKGKRKPLSEYFRRV